jgi:peroxiredoxin/YHS domain-containing protein
MKRMVLMLSLVVLLGPAALRASVREAVCIVCQVKEGATHAEPVKAVRTHEGREYGFCSEKCAKEFDADAAAFVPPMLPRPAPAFSLLDLEGRKVSLEGMKGQIVLLDFWATWCAPCRKSMPELDDLHRRYRDRGVTVLGVSIDEGGAAKVRKFLKTRSVSYPIALDSEKAPAWEAYRVKSVPAAFLIDREGRIVAQWTGRSADPAAVEAKLAELLPRD